MIHLVWIIGVDTTTKQHFPIITIRRKKWNRTMYYDYERDCIHACDQLNKKVLQHG